MESIAASVELCCGIFLHFGAKEPGYRELMDSGDALFIRGNTLPTRQMVFAQQVHGAYVHICSASDGGAGLKAKAAIPKADALISNIPRQYLLIRTADCLPILLYDAHKKVVAAVHSGREGSRQNIVGETIERMKQEFDCESKDIFAQVGPGICEAHYQVSQELYDEFNSSMLEQGFSPSLNQNRHLNLRSTVFQQLIRAGLPFFNIDNHQICTFENPGYYSYRRDATQNRQINIIGIQDE